MIERIPTAQAAQNNERISAAEHTLGVPQLRESVSEILTEFPSLQGMSNEAAEAVFRSKVQAVYETVRDHLDTVEEKSEETSELLSESEFRTVLEDLFGNISKIISNNGERMNSVQVDITTMPELDTLQGMYRNLLDRRSQN